MTFVPLILKPGVYKDDSAMAAAGYFIDANNGRFVRDKFEIRGGCEYAATGVLLGYARGMHAWRDNSALSYVGIGTHSNVYAFTDGANYDITPIISRGQISISFTTVITSAVVTASWTAHGMVAGQSFTLRNSTVTTIGGVTINTTAATAAAPSPAYIVVSVTDANTFTFTAAQTATASAGPTAATCDYYIYLAPGLADSLGGAGYGTGGYGSGTYGTSSATSYACRTWAMDHWQQNLLAVPRNGGLYEFSPLLAQTELVTNGDMSSATGWTQGTGWLIAAGVATATAGAGSDLSTVITMNAAAWFVLEFDYTRSAGTLQPKIGTTSLGSALSSATGHVALVFYTGTSPLIFTKDATFAGTVDNVSVKQLINMNIVTGAPTKNTCMLVTAEFICMVFGTNERVSGNFNPLCIRTSDQFGNPANTGVPLQTWTPTTSNQSTELYLAEGGRIVGAMNTRGGVLCWTDTALYFGRYVPDPNIVYTFDLVSAGCGLLGPNAACIVDGIAYWMSNNGSFYRYAGGGAEAIESTCRKDVYNNLAFVQQDKVYASAISAFGEAQFLYPDSRDGAGVECSRYIKFNPRGNSIPVWDPGTYTRTAWIDQGIVPFPMAVGTDGYVYFQEKGDSVNGGAMTARARTGAIPLGDGGNLWQCSGLIPDIKNQKGAVSVTPYTYLYPQPQGSEVANGPYSLLTSTTKLDFIVVGRLISYDFQWNAAPCGGRFGNMTQDIKDTGMAF